MEFFNGQGPSTLTLATLGIVCLAIHDLRRGASSRLRGESRAIWQKLSLMAAVVGIPWTRYRARRQARLLSLSQLKHPTPAAPALQKKVAA